MLIWTFCDPRRYFDYEEYRIDVSCIIAHQSSHCGWDARAPGKCALLANARAQKYTLVILQVYILLWIIQRFCKVAKWYIYTDTYETIAPL